MLILGEKHTVKQRWLQMDRHPVKPQNRLPEMNCILFSLQRKGGSFHLVWSYVFVSVVHSSSSQQLCSINPIRIVWLLLLIVDFYILWLWQLLLLIYILL